ncbi:MAG: cell division protein FtsL [Deltaproteobacteria bacterium]|nr:cell division protein FtsL [Deltaproteobacteria bacterium]
MWHSLRAFFTSTPVLLVLCAATVLSALVGRVMARTTVVRLGYTLSTLQQQNQSLAQELNALRTELAARRAPDALAKEARGRFLLDAPKAEQIVTVTTAPRAPR